MKNFTLMNKFAKKRQCVFFGSTQFSQTEFTEMFENSCSERIYNRSVENLDMQNVSEFMNICAIDLEPSKLFINIGEEDIKNPDFNLENFISKYEWLLYQIHKNCSDCTLYVVPVISNEEKVRSVNRALEKLSLETGCIFVKLNVMTFSNLVSSLKLYLRDFPITFADAMQYAG